MLLWAERPQCLVETTKNSEAVQLGTETSTGDNTVVQQTLADFSKRQWAHETFIEVAFESNRAKCRQKLENKVLVGDTETDTGDDTVEQWAHTGFSKRQRGRYMIVEVEFDSNRANCRRT